MPAMDWDDFHEAHYRPHLIVAELGPRADPELNSAHVALLNRLAAELEIVGNYSIREEYGSIKAVFERHVDARKFGDALLSKAGSGSSDWASQSKFQFDRKTRQRILDTLRKSRVKFTKRSPVKR